MHHRAPAITRDSRILSAVQKPLAIAVRGTPPLRPALIIQINTPAPRTNSVIKFESVFSVSLNRAPVYDPSS